jgi:hypothetical protein
MHEGFVHVHVVDEKAVYHQGRRVFRSLAGRLSLYWLRRHFTAEEVALVETVKQVTGTLGALGFAFHDIDGCFRPAVHF